METAYLQLVMSRLWDEERMAGSSLLRSSTLERLGGTERLVSGYIDDVLAALSPRQRNDAADLLRFLTTLSGTAIALSADDLSYFSDLPRDRVDSVLQRLDERRIVRRTMMQDAAVYELAHGVLAPAIFDWRLRYLEGWRRVVCSGAGGSAAKTAAAAVEAVAAIQSDLRPQLDDLPRRLRCLLRGTSTCPRFQPTRAALELRATVHEADMSDAALSTSSAATWHVWWLDQADWVRTSVRPRCC